MDKPTVHDIANAAGVSLATVDRVLNARPGVREKTIAKVQAAVEQLGYVRDTHAANLARQRQYRFAFVLPEGPNQFVDTLRGALAEACSSQVADRAQIRTVFVPANDPHATVATLRSLDRLQPDGIAILTPETPQVRDAIDRIRERGIAVVALASDLPNTRRDYFVGTNSIAAGRTAAALMGRFAAAGGEVLVVTNALTARDSLERRLGFDEVIAREYARLTVLPTVESYDDNRRMEKVVGDIVRTNRSLAGIYSMGAGNTALLRALQDAGIRKDLVVIAHELTPATRQALLDGEITAVIAQNVGHLVRSAIRVLRTLCDGHPIFEAQERVRIEVVLKENLQ